MILLTFNIIHNKKEFAGSVRIGDETIVDITQKNTESILMILEKHNLLATFFVDVTLIEELQPLVRKVISQGHEIALYSDQSGIHTLETAKRNTENRIGKLIRGIRQKEPTFSLDELKALEFNYVSNIENTDILFPFKRLKRKTEITEQNGISIIPESISPYSQIPYNDFILQVLPLTYYENMVFETIKNDDFVLIYLNTWQLTDFEKYRFKIPFYRKYGAGRKMSDKLDDFLAWINENELPTSRMKDYIF